MTGLPSHRIRNLKFLYGSTLFAFFTNPLAMSHSLYVGYLLDRDDHKLSRFEWCETNLDVDYPEVSVVGGRRLAIAFDEKRLVRSAALKRALTKESQHKGVDVHADLRPE